MGYTTICISSSLPVAACFLLQNIGMFVTQVAAPVRFVVLEGEPDKIRANMRSGSVRDRLIISLLLYHPLKNLNHLNDSRLLLHASAAMTTAKIYELLA